MALVGMSLWEQAGIDLTGARERATAAANVDEERAGGGGGVKKLVWDNGR